MQRAGERFLAAAVQMTSTSDAAANLAAATEGIRRAARLGARFVATPENTDFLGPHADKIARAEATDGPLCTHYARLAAEHGIHLLLGSFAERSSHPKKVHNTSVLFGPDGRIVTSYRKLHLFDVDVSAEARFKESDTVVPGDAVVTAETDLGTIGLSVCYDLRFPELYRALRDRGAFLLTIPSAFTLTTGKDHWEVLVRARAIETQCWVVAPGQSGRHDDGGLRNSWGHSMIVDPWGHVVGMSSDGPGLALAEIEPRRVQEVRRGMPITTHRRL
jgi:predicted amidohydrolase